MRSSPEALAEIKSVIEGLRREPVFVDEAHNWVLERIGTKVRLRKARKQE